MKKNLRCLQQILCVLTSAALLAGCGAGPSASSGSSSSGSPAQKSFQTEAAAETWAETAAAFDGMYFEAGEADASAVNGDSSMSMKYQAAYGGGDFNTEEYNYISENGYKTTVKEPLSTFSVDVDTASYSNLRRYINSGQQIPADAVRIEEMLNYFSYDYPEPVFRLPLERRQPPSAYRAAGQRDRFLPPPPVQPGIPSGYLRFHVF